MTTNIVTKLEQTCFACPSQWDGELADGTTFYARYRYGTFSVEFYDQFGRGTTGTSEQVGDSLDGMMTTEEMLHRAGLVMA
jgi:hypothetical protein